MSIAFRQHDGRAPFSHSLDNIFADETVASLSQRYRIRYHALTRQYLTTNLNSKVRSAYPNLAIALANLGTISSLPVLDQRLLKPNSHYLGRIRSRLAIEHLPSPLRLWTYFYSDWNLSSPWHQWVLQ